MVTSLKGSNWIKLPANQEVAESRKQIILKIDDSHDQYQNMNFSNLYGELEPGTYRITMTLYNYNTGGYVEYYEGKFSSKFEIIDLTK